MNLQELSLISVKESYDLYDSVTILENGEGPRWRFNYNNFKNDPKPDILLLGAYRHPTTGNNLVGGINLHYLTKQQIEDLAKVLPRIMAANNLYYRYHTGKQLLPEVFTKFYRTYDAKYIRGIEKDIMYPKYGLIKTTADWMKKKVAGLLKSKQQRAKEAEPKYPQDLSSMNTQLDTVVRQLQQVPASSPQADEPEVVQAKEQIPQQRIDNTEAGIQRNIDEPLRQAFRDKKRAENPELKPTKPLDQIGPKIPTDDYEEQLPPQQQLQQKRQRFEQEEQENMQELMEPSETTEIEQPTPTPEINTLDDDKLEESIIRYYSPRLNRYITETVSLIKI